MMQKKLICLLLALSLLLSCAALAEPMEKASVLPSVGDVVHGFEVTEVSRMELIGAYTVYFTHQKTGAQLLYIACDDTNRLYELTFRTPATSDMGTPHVFEHSTLDGSEKYPSKALWFNLNYQTYNTYMNASTYNFMTTYPVASLSEAQLLKYCDFYTDSCLHPMVLKDESIFKEEAWRYALDDPEDELTLTGTVYSEMLGATTKQRAAGLNFKKTLFPGSTRSNDSGGVPASIPDLTWQDVKDYHATYYHPSNAIAVLYGRFEDYAAFLEVLDGYFSEYEKKEIVIRDEGYIPVSEPLTAHFDFPVEAGSDTAQGAVVYYGFACPGIPYMIIDELTTLLNAESSPLMKLLREKMPTASCSCYSDPSTADPCVYFLAQNVEAQDGELFRQTVDEGVRATIEQGFEQASVEAIIASYRLSYKLVTENSDVGVNLVPEILFYGVLENDLHAYQQYIEDTDNFDAWNRDGTFLKAMQTYLADNPRNALVVTAPVAGAKEEQDAALKARLADIKAAMSEEEIKRIVSDTKQAAEDAAAGSDEQTRRMVAQLQAVDAASLPEEMREYALEDEAGEDGVRRLAVPANVDAVGQTLLMLDAQGLPREDIHWFKLYTDLLGALDTSAHTRAELADLAGRYLYGFESRISALNVKDTPYPKLRVGWIAADEDLAKGYDLVYELLYDTQFTDAGKVADEISSIRQRLRAGIISDPASLMLYRGLSAISEPFHYYSYANHLAYYDFLTKAQAQMETDPEGVLDRLSAIQRALRNRTNAISGYVGGEGGIAANRAAADTFLARLDARPIERATYELPQIPAREAIALDSAVNYNLVVAKYEEMGLEGFTGDLKAVGTLVQDAYLLPMLRDQYGAYGAFNGVQEEGMYVYSYRDPNIARSYEAYDALPDYLGAFEIDQATLDGYILSSYSSYAKSSGELSGGLSWMLNVLQEKDPARNLACMRQLKALKAEDISRYAGIYRKMVERGARVTVGGAAAIEEAAELFDTVSNPFSAADDD